MPSNSKFDYAFAFLSTKTGNPVKSEAKKIRALKRFFDSQGAVNDVEGVHVVIRWRNPKDKAARSRRWKTSDEFGQSLEDAYATLHYSRGLLYQAEQKAKREYEKYRR